MGEGGGSSSRGDVRAGVPLPAVGEEGDKAGSEALALREDLLDFGASVSVSPSMPSVIKADVRGLSVLEPGILDRSVLKDLAESLVSDLMNEGKA